LTENELHEAHGDRAKEKALLVRKYRFVLALENSIAPDYVTEKVGGSTGPVATDAWGG